MNSIINNLKSNNMKRLLLLFSAYMLSISALWANDVEIDGIFYNIDETNKTASVTYKGNSAFEYSNEYEGIIVIPETIAYNLENYKVVSIGDWAFANCKDLTSITFGSSITLIDEHAFAGCAGLNKVNYLGSVDEWVEIYFGYSDSNPTRYAGDIYINNELLTDVKILSAKSINRNAFYYCSSIKSIEIGNSVTSINSSAFIQCGLTSVVWNINKSKDFTSSDAPFHAIKSQITSFTFGNEVKHIPAFLCDGMSNLKEIIIPSSVNSIGLRAFSACWGLTKVNFLGTIDKWAEFDFGYSSYNPTYYTKDLYINDKLLTDVKITSADSIKKYTFYDCASIKSVEFGNTVTYIGDQAFYGCNKLGKVNYLGTVDEWVGIKFESGDSNPTCYANDLYINNELLTNVKITSANTINEYAFYHCRSIEYVELNNSVISIRFSAFGFCGALTSITIPTSVNFVGDYAFYNCNYLSTVNYLGTVDEWVGIEFDDSTSNPTYYAEDLYIDGDLLTDVKISSAESIKDYVFTNCSSIKSILIGKSVSFIGNQSFKGCDNVEKVFAYPTTIPTVNENSFDCYNATLYVPCDLYDAYSNHEVFGKFKVIKCINDDEPTDVVETLADANITISDGTISADTDFIIYNTIGQDVTAYNGSLQPGVYVVSIADDVIKVMMK